MGIFRYKVLPKNAHGLHQPYATKSIQVELLRNGGKYLIVQEVLSQPGRFNPVSGRSSSGRM